VNSPAWSSGTAVRCDLRRALGRKKGLGRKRIQYRLRGTGESRGQRSGALDSHHPLDTCGGGPCRRKILPGRASGGPWGVPDWQRNPLTKTSGSRPASVSSAGRNHGAKTDTMGTPFVDSSLATTCAMLSDAAFSFVDHGRRGRMTMDADGSVTEAVSRHCGAPSAVTQPLSEDQGGHAWNWGLVKFQRPFQQLSLSGAWCSPCYYPGRCQRQKDVGSITAEGEQQFDERGTRISGLWPGRTGKRRSSTAASRRCRKE